MHGDGQGDAAATGVTGTTEDVVVGAAATGVTGATEDVVVGAGQDDAATGGRNTVSDGYGDEEGAGDATEAEAVGAMTTIGAIATVDEQGVGYVVTSNDDRSVLSDVMIALGDGDVL